jgi:hypothetical protein
MSAQKDSKMLDAILDSLYDEFPRISPEAKAAVPVLVAFEMIEVITKIRKFITQYELAGILAGANAKVKTDAATQ